jgi:hypothetical protein
MFRLAGIGEGDFKWGIRVISEREGVEKGLAYLRTSLMRGRLVKI